MESTEASCYCSNDLFSLFERFLLEKAVASSTQRKVRRGCPDEERLAADLIALARQCGRYGYRKIAGLLEQAGWLVNDKRVERIWKRAGLKVPHKQPKRDRLYLADGSCIRLRPEHRNHVWPYDFVEDPAS